MQAKNSNRGSAKAKDLLDAMEAKTEDLHYGEFLLRALAGVLNDEKIVVPHPIDLGIAIQSFSRALFLLGDVHGLKELSLTLFRDAKSIAKSANLLDNKTDSPKPLSRIDPSLN